VVGKDWSNPFLSLLSHQPTLWATSPNPSKTDKDLIPHNTLKVKQVTSGQGHTISNLTSKPNGQSRKQVRVWNYVGFEVLTEVVMSSSVIRDITLCIHWKLTGVSEEHIDSVCSLLHAGFLFGLLFSPEDGRHMLLWNSRWLSADYMALCPRRVAMKCISILKT
jgi:hypothetical protein